MGREGLVTGASHAPLVLILWITGHRYRATSVKKQGKGETYMRRLAAILISLFLMLTSVSAVAADAMSASQPAQPQDGCTYYSETQHNLCAGFRAYWEKYGGLAVFGYPITEEYVDNGMTVQYFERARFEWHPGEWPERWDVMLGLLGNTYASNLGLMGTAPFTHHDNTSGCATYSGTGSTGCVYFAATGHSVSGKFLDYWNMHGGLAIFGYPISDQYTENGHTVQYFERQRFELHPEFAGTPYEVLLGRLGAKILNGASLEVVAAGLNNPRGVTVASDGTIYIAEAGAGGTGQCFEDPEGGTSCFGTSGVIAKVVNGQATDYVTGLPSTADDQGMFASGPADVSANDGSLVAVIQGIGTPEDNAQFGDGGKLLGHLIKITGPNQYTDIADLAAYEAANNPDGAQIDSDPYSVLDLGDKYIVADAAANDLLQVDADGTITTLAVFPPQMVDAPPELGMPEGSQIPSESVPTSVALGPDGAYYVGELTGFPFPTGGARVWRVVPGEDPTVYADGFTNIISLTFDSFGNLYVLEITKHGLLAAESAGPDDIEAVTGALIQVHPDGSKAQIASDGLVTPGGVAIDQAGNIYVTNFSVFSGPGALVRVDY